MLNTLRLCFDKWAELIKPLKTHSRQQSVSRSRPTKYVSNNFFLTAQRSTERHLL